MSLNDPEEQEQRDNIRAHMSEGFMLPPEAVEFLAKVWRATQFFDDVADGDTVERDDLNHVLWDFFIGFCSDPFYVAHYGPLKGILSALVLKWQASDEAERNGEASAKSYMWRAGFYDVALVVVAIVHGHDGALEASKAMMDFYGETLEEYLEEFGKHV